MQFWIHRNAFLQQKCNFIPAVHATLNIKPSLPLYRTHYLETYRCKKRIWLFHVYNNVNILHVNKLSFCAYLTNISPVYKRIRSTSSQFTWRSLVLQIMPHNALRVALWRSRLRQSKRTALICALASPRLSSFIRSTVTMSTSNSEARNSQPFPKHFDNCAASFSLNVCRRVCPDKG